MIKPIRILFLLLFSGLVIFLYLGLPHIFAGVLKNIFQQGTGCDVSLKDPEIDYINQTASIHDAKIVCSGESGNEGFYAKKITAGIEVSKLFEKRAIVTPLRLEGAKAISLSWDSAFIKTLEFVLQKPAVKRTSWKAWVPEVEITTSSSEYNVFEFGTKDASVVADSVRFTAIDAVDRPETAVVLEAHGKNARLKVSSNELVTLGEVDFVAQAKDGKILFVKTSVVSPDQGVSHTADGFILSKTDLFNLDVHTVFSASSPMPLKIGNTEYLYTGNASVETQIRGSFKKPEIYSALQTSNVLSYGIKSERGVNTDRPCLPIKANAKVKISTEESVINILEVDRVMKASNLTFNYSSGYHLKHKDALFVNLNGLNRLLCNDESSDNSKNDLFIPITASLDVSPKGVLNGELISQNIKLEELPFVSSILKKGSHLAQIHVTAKGTLNQPSIDGKLTSKSSGVEKVMPSEVSFSYTSKGLDFKGYVFGQENTFSGSTLKPEKAKTSNTINANLKKFPLIFFTNAQVETLMYSQLEGELSSVSDSFSDLLGSIKLYEIDLSPQYPKFKPPTPITIKAVSGSYEISTVPFDFQGLKVDLQGKVSKNKDLKLSTHVAGDLPIVLAKLVGVESLTGNLQADVKIDGTLDTPKIFGKLVVDEGATSFKIGNRVSSIDKITSLITFDDTTIEIRKLEGSFGEGSIRVLGKIDSFLSPTSRAGQIGVFGDNLLLEPISGLSMYVDANLAMLYFAKGYPIIKGDIILNEATYQKNFSIQTIVDGVRSFILGSRSRIRDTRDNQAVPIVLDIHARSSQGLLVDTTVLQAELDGDLKVIGSTIEPRVEGEVHILDGGFKINQTQFSIMSGSMKFDGSPQINPTVHLSSEGDLRKRSGETEKIFLNVAGPLNATKVSFSSDGASRPNDIVRQLGLGAGGSQFALIDSNRKNVGFREVLSPSSDLSLSERFAGLTGFDQVRIENAVSVRTGDFVPQVLASRPFPYELRGTIWSELAGDRASGARMERRLQDNYSVFVGWRNQSVIDASASTSGSNVSVGFRFKEAFKGFSFFEQRIKVLE